MCCEIIKQGRGGNSSIEKLVATSGVEERRIELWSLKKETITKEYDQRDRIIDMYQIYRVIIEDTSPFHTGINI